MPSQQSISNPLPSPQGVTDRDVDGGEGAILSSQLKPVSKEQSLIAAKSMLDIPCSPILMELVAQGSNADTKHLRRISRSVFRSF